MVNLCMKHGNDSMIFFVKCLYHGLPNWLIIQTFYNGLISSARTTIGAVIGETLKGKAIDEAHDLLEEMVANNC